MTEATNDDGPKRRYPPSIRREMVLDAAEALFLERGYGGVTMEAIAQGAAVSRPVVYRHFDSLERAYVACVERARAQYNTLMFEHTHPEDAPLVQIRSGANIFFSMLEDSPGRWRLLFTSNTFLPGEYNAELANLRFSTIDNIADLLRRAAPERTPPARVEAGAHAMSGIGERLGHLWLRRPELTKDELVDHYVALVWQGLQPYVDDATEFTPPPPA